ncbi:LysR family transcriptional regulator [Bacterioplanoides sp.]|uniref:LysR family transcriptional regulator n=1 Tax=Bacterioplanoides sp. TaxID=2066072 RepID=UPI003B002465
MSALNSLDLRQLRTLHLLLQEQNVSRVADQLGISQQAVSDQLKKLRQRFDDRLFIRRGNGLAPTPYAESLQPKIANVFNALEQLTEPPIFDPATVNRTFTISCTDLEQKAILPGLLQQLRAQAPQLKLAVKTLNLDQIAADLLNGDIDLVITNPQFAPPSYPATTLYQEQYVCVASRTNRLIRPYMTVAEIARIPQLVVSPSRGDFSGAAQQWFEQQGHPRSVLLSVPTFTAAKAAIAATDLCGFIPARLLPDPELTAISLDVDIPGFDVIAVWHQRSSQDPLHQWLRQQLIEVSSN